MDVADTRFGTRARDRDELALQVLNVFKRFLEEYTDGNRNNDESVEEEKMRDDVTNDSFASARSGAGGPAESVAAGSSASAGQPKGPSKYSEDALLLLSNERNTLFIDFKDIEMFDHNLAEDVINDYYRFYPYLCRAVAAFVREEKIRQAENMLDPNIGATDRLSAREQIKRELDSPQIRNKNYYVGFYNLASRDNIRELTSVKIGTLTRVTGQVVRTHSVHPELIIGNFVCEDCLTEQYTEQQFRYTQPALCANENCANRTRFRLNLDKSRFTDFQRVRIQETQQEIPRGSIPRSFDVVLRGADQVECIQPGDQCDFIGTLVALPDVGQMMSGIFGTVSRELSSESGVTGLKTLGVKEMTYTLAFLASACVVDGQQKPCINTDSSYRDSLNEFHASDFTKEEIAKIETMSKDPKLLDNLSQSLFSSVYGSEDVKRGIILQLLGGVPKSTTTGTKLRGDVNICLVGDPSTAKSQFLKIVTDFAPVKSVYASGKGSSASGLTAAVVRDNDGGFVIEAGALMLADRGICCIDEFDKMDLKDQVAIHEAMEQQTISITKAGVTATLNARASILAAANPIGGTYDVNRDLRSNLSFSLPIMSRFDLFFVIIDPHEEYNDRSIASRILDMHMTFANPKENRKNIVYTFEEVRLYLRFARKYYPKIPISTERVFVREYVRLRGDSKSSRRAWRITVRQLESLIRLSEAIARAHCDETVKPEYVKMAASLIEKTQVFVGNPDVELTQQKDGGGMDTGMDTSMGGDEISAAADQGHFPGEIESQPLGPSQSTQSSMKISLTTYKAMAELLFTKLHNESEFQDRDVPAIRRSELVDWYLHQCVGDIHTETELIKRKHLCESVLDRLVQRENILLELQDDGGIIDPDAERGPEEDRLIMINPNFNNDINDMLEQVL